MLNRKLIAGFGFGLVLATGCGDRKVEPAPPQAAKAPADSRPAPVPSPETNAAAPVVEKSALPPKPKSPPPERMRAEQATLKPLQVGQAVFADRPQPTWANIPPSLTNMLFTFHPGAQSHTLNAKILDRGVFYLAATLRSARFGEGAKTTPGFVTLAALQRRGWKQLIDRARLMDSEKEWIVFERACEPGEEFSYRTEDYHAPILMHPASAAFTAQAKMASLAGPPKATNSAAGVIVEKSVRKLLRPGAPVFADRPEQRWATVPQALEGMVYTQHSGAQDHTVYFEITSDGWAYVAITQRSLRQAPGSIAGAHFVTLATLRQRGWNPVPNLGPLRDSEQEWMLLFRKCRAGEKFAFRTENYHPPIVLTRPGE